MTGGPERASDGHAAARTDRLPEAGVDAREEEGAVVWITGFRASGKTTVACALVARMRERWPGTVLLDGDELRAAFEHDLGYDRDDRRRAARRYARLARLLARQRLHVVVATVSLFADVHRWNREHLPGYLEVYLRVPLAFREARDRRRGETRPPVGGAADDEPTTPDLVIDDRGDLDPHEIAQRILTRLVPALPLERGR